MSPDLISPDLVSPDPMSPDPMSPDQRPAQSGIFARNTQRNATNEFRGIIHSQRKVQIPTFSENISVRYLSFSYLL